MMVWTGSAVALSALGVTSALLAASAIARGERRLIRSLGDAAGALVTVVGRVSGAPIRSPVTFHPCAVWWCWVDRFVPPGRYGEHGGWAGVGGASSAGFVLEDPTGRLTLEASQCRLSNPPGAEVVLRPDDWAPPGASQFHDGLRQVCGAAGLPRPDAEGGVRVRESLLPLNATVAARGLVVLGPGGMGDAGYRGQTASSADLCPPPGGWIELSPR